MPRRSPTRPTWKDGCSPTQEKRKSINSIPFVFSFWATIQRGRMDVRPHKKYERYGIDDLAFFLIVKERACVDQERTEKIGKYFRSRLQPDSESNREDQ